MKKLIKNKFFVLTICVILVSTLYFIAKKLIDEYSYRMNEDIVTEEEIITEEVNEGNEENISTEETDLLVEEEETFDVGDDEKELRKIYVYITGEVNVPGVVILNEGGRIIDAINAAGGTTANANISKVNLVYVLKDGMKVNIPNNNELQNNSEFEYITMNSGDGSANNYVSEKEPSSSTKNSGIVNINTATQTELETLPGIGPSLALKIINYRKENGKFTSIEQLKEVSGIGDSKYENLKKYVII